MKRRAAGNVSLSFVDCIASSLGAVIVLNLVLAVMARNMAELRQAQRLSVDIQVESASAAQIPCTIQFFLRRADSAQEVPEAVGAVPQAQLKVDGATVGVKRFGNVMQGHATLWLDDLPPGGWDVAVWLTPRGIEQPRPAEVTLRATIGSASPVESTARFILPPGLRKLSFDKDFPGLREAHGDFLRLVVPEGK